MIGDTESSSEGKGPVREQDLPLPRRPDIQPRQYSTSYNATMEDHPDMMYPKATHGHYQQRLRDPVYHQDQRPLMKHLECAYLAELGFCKFTESQCLYAHHRTGKIAHRPAVRQLGRKSRPEEDIRAYWRSYDGPFANPKPVRNHVIHHQLKNIHAKAKAAKKEHDSTTDSLKLSLPECHREHAVGRSASHTIKQETPCPQRASRSESGEYTGSETSRSRPTEIMPTNDADENHENVFQARSDKSRAPDMSPHHQRLLNNQQDIIKLQNEIIKNMATELNAMSTSLALCTGKTLDVTGELRGVVDGHPKPTLLIADRLASTTQHILDLAESNTQTLREHKQFRQTISERLAARNLGHLIAGVWSPSEAKRPVVHQDRDPRPEEVREIYDWSSRGSKKKRL